MTRLKLNVKKMINLKKQLRNDLTVYINNICERCVISNEWSECTKHIEILLKREMNLENS